MILVIGDTPVISQLTRLANGSVRAFRWYYGPRWGGLLKHEVTIFSVQSIVNDPASPSAFGKALLTVAGGPWLM